MYSCLQQIPQALGDDQYPRPGGDIDSPSHAGSHADVGHNDVRAAGHTEKETAHRTLDREWEVNTLSPSPRPT